MIALGFVAAIAALAFAFWPRNCAPVREAPLRPEPTEIKPAGTALDVMPEAPSRATPGAVPLPSTDTSDPPKPGPTELPPTTPRPTADGQEPSEVIPAEAPSSAPPRPSKIKPSPAAPRTPLADDAACKAMREEAERARDALDAATVVAKTSSKRCWPDGSARLRLRIPALFSLARYDDCAREGKASSDGRPSLVGHRSCLRYGRGRRRANRWPQRSADLSAIARRSALDGGRQRPWAGTRRGAAQSRHGCRPRAALIC